MRARVSVSIIVAFIFILTTLAAAGPSATGPGSEAEYAPPAVPVESPVDPGAASLSSSNERAAGENIPARGPGYEILGMSTGPAGIFMTLAPNDAVIDKVGRGGYTFTTITIDGAGYTQEPGLPLLPRVAVLLAVPTSDVSVKAVADGGETQFTGTVIPAQPPAPDFQGGPYPEDPLVMDEEWYASASVYPAEPASVAETGKVRDIHFVLVYICPVQVDAASGTASIHDTITLEVAWDPEAVDDSPVPRALDFGDVYRASFMNWAQYEDRFVTWEEPPEPPLGGTRSPGGEPSCEYLIITDPSFAPAAEALAKWKNQRGIWTEVVNTTVTGATSAELMAFLKVAFDNWTVCPSYVLLLGDAEYIPTNYLYIHPYYNALTGTDLWYATLSGDDHFADVFMGRMPADSPDVAMLMVNKSLMYETEPPDDPDYYDSVTMAAYFQDPGHDGYEDRRFVLTSEEVRDFLLTQGKDVERIYCTEGAVTPTNWNNGGYAGGDAIPQELLRSSGFAWDGDAADISAAVNGGTSILNHRDHGWRGGWGDPYYNINHVKALSNSFLPLVFSINCETGWFDQETDTHGGTNSESFSEEFIRKADGGAVAVFGASRVSYSGYNDFLCRGFYDAMYPSFDPDFGDNTTMYRLGQVMDYGKIYMSGTWNSWRLENEIFHVFGDPTMEVWTSMPEELKVDHPGLVSFDAGAVRVDVAQEGASVCIVQDGKIVGRGTAREGGVTIRVPTLSGSPLLVTVTKHDHLPYQGVIEVFEDLSPECGYTGDGYGFEVTGIAGPGVEEVKVEWSHGALMGYEGLSKNGGAWGAEVELDHSTSPLEYIIRVKDAQGNWSHTEPQKAPVRDNDAPGFEYLGETGPTTGDLFTFAFSAHDNIDPPTLSVNWTHGAMGGNVTLARTEDLWTAGVLLDHSLDPLIHRVWGNDSSGNVNSSDVISMPVTDNDSPWVIDGSMNSGVTGEGFLWSVQAFDNVAVDSVFARYTHGTTGGNLSLTLDDGMYVGDIVLDQDPAGLEYTILTLDTSGNVNVTAPGKVKVADPYLPWWEDDSPENGYTGGTYEFRVRAGDNVGVWSVDIDWDHEGAGRYVQLEPSDGFWGGEVTLDHSVRELTYTIYVTDTSGNRNTSHLICRPVRDNVPPVAGATGYIETPQHRDVVFDGRRSSDNIDVDIWEWSFNDAEEAVVNGARAPHAFHTVGLYDVTLTVYDAAGNSGSMAIRVNVTDAEAPVADAGPDVSVGHNTTVAFSGLNSTDNVGIVGYMWQFTYDGAGVTILEPSPEFLFLTPGIYEVILTVFDRVGYNGTDTKTVEVLAPPEPVGDPPETLMDTGDPKKGDGVDDRSGDGSVSAGVLLAAVAAMVVAALLLLLIARRRRKAAPPEGEEPAPDETTGDVPGLDDDGGGGAVEAGARDEPAPAAIPPSLPRAIPAAQPVTE